MRTSLQHRTQVLQDRLDSDLEAVKINSKSRIIDLKHFKNIIYLCILWICFILEFFKSTNN